MSILLGRPGRRRKLSGPGPAPVAAGHARQLSAALSEASARLLVRLKGEETGKDGLPGEAVAGASIALGWIELVASRAGGTCMYSGMNYSRKAPYVYLKS